MNTISSTSMTSTMGVMLIATMVARLRRRPRRLASPPSGWAVTATAQATLAASSSRESTTANSSEKLESRLA